MTPFADAPPSNFPADSAGASATVVGRYTFYANTPFFGDVWAPDKTALLPSQTATFNNVTNYNGGIDEVVIDVSNAAASYNASNFTFRVGQSGDPSSWALAPAPVSVTTVAGAGANGSTRIYIKWNDGSVVNTWLQVNFTPANDTFYFGNIIGATNGLQVTAADEATVRTNPMTLLSPAAITNNCDFNRDGKVDALDQLTSRAAAGLSLSQFTAPAITAATSTYDWHQQTINGALNIWAPNPSDFGSIWTVTDPNALFGSDGIPQITGVHQGPTADCYFLSAGAAIAFSNPSRIQSLVTNDTTGGWAVTFQYFDYNTGRYIPVVIHTDKTLSSSLQTVANGEVWSLVLEKAYAAFRTWNGVTSTNTMASLNWGFAGTALNALNDPNTSAFYTGMTAQWDYSTLQTALANHQPIDFHTSSTAPTMVQSHVYTITGVYTDANGVRWVTTYNPWGFYDTRTLTDLLNNGIGSFVIGTA